MLLDAGASLAIVGHSERREAQHESDADVRAKAEAALRAGLSVILCVGESLEVREAGEALATVAAQLDASLPHGNSAAAGVPSKFAIAYEPIWAIGTGRTATCDDIGAMHAALRAAAGRGLWRGRQRRPDSLRRVGQGGQCRRDIRGRRCRRRAGRRGQPQGRRLPAHRRGRGRALVERTRAIA